MAWAFVWFFCILTAYFVLRPLRETFAVERGTSELPWLFAATLLAIVCASPVFAALAARLSRPRLVQTVYHFFALNLVLFLLADLFVSDTARPWLARVFYIWISVFALFNTSVFWSVLTDLFSNTQSKRLFGLVAAGGTLGGITGSVLTAAYAKQLGTAYLLVLPIVFIELGLVAAGRLQAAATDLPSQVARRGIAPPTGGSVLTGLKHVFQSPYLLGVCGFLLLGQFCATHLYLAQTSIVDVAVEKADRPALFAMMNLTIQLLTLALQTLVFGFFTRRFGVPFILLIVPVLYGVCFASLAYRPQLSVLVPAVIACTALTYGMIVPSREVLFTVIRREDKYKSKNFIDTAVMRGGDTASVTMLEAVGSTTQLAVPFVIAVMCPLALLWGTTGFLLGRKQQQLAGATATNEEGIAA